MKAVKTVRVYVAAGEGVEDARRAVADVMEMLNRHFRPRGVEFVGAAEGEGDWTIALYWKDFGGMERDEFETVYEKFKKEKRPVIHVFFKEPDEEIGEALKVFKEAFAEKYGHFYCHYETVDAVRFQLAAQSLSMLPGGEGERNALTVVDGEVRLGKDPVAQMEHLSFAKLNRKRRDLLEEIARYETRVARLQEDATENPRDADLQDALREARVTRHDLREKLKQHDGYLFDMAVDFAKLTTQETNARVRKAWELFEQGKVADANKLLDLAEMKERAKRKLAAYDAAMEGFDADILEFLAKAKMALADDTKPLEERVGEAADSYDNAIHVAEKIRWEEPKLARLHFEYGVFLAQHGRMADAACSFQRSSDLFKLCVFCGKEPDMSKGTLLNNLGLAHKALGQFELAESELREAIAFFEKERADHDGTVSALDLDVAMAKTNLGNLQYAQGFGEEAEKSYLSAIETLKGARDEVVHEREWLEEAGRVSNSLGSLHHELGKTWEAEKDFEEALRWRQQLEKEHPGKYRREVATTLINWGVLLMETDCFAEARAKYETALPVIQAAAAENPLRNEDRLALVLNNLANLDSAEGDFDAAEPRYDKAIEIRHRIWEREPGVEQSADELATSLNNRANLFCETNRAEEAEEDYLQALSLYRTIVRPDSLAYRDGQGRVLYNLALLHEAQGKNEEAIQEYQASLKDRQAIAKEFPFRSGDVEETQDALSALLARVVRNRLLETE